jgi:hypothetical protein
MNNEIEARINALERHVRRPDIERSEAPETAVSKDIDCQ